jgi:hypothetical protein
MRVMYGAKPENSAKDRGLRKRWAATREMEFSASWTAEGARGGDVSKATDLMDSRKDESRSPMGIPLSGRETC